MDVEVLPVWAQNQATEPQTARNILLRAKAIEGGAARTFMGVRRSRKWQSSMVSMGS